ncbi:MAG: LysR family transcriptional regulator [Rhodopseudomonas sp.]|nr:LysR family transcriptional regulator [Rhodopseudomonas sp.]
MVKSSTRNFEVHEAAIVYFDAVWRVGSIRAAARKLNVASSAVNRQIIKREAVLGTALFDRVPGGLKLTAAGELFAHHAVTVLQDFERMVSRIQALQGLLAGHVEVDVVEGLCVDLMPDAIGAMRTRYPRITIGCGIRPTAEIPTAILNGDTHLGAAFQVARHSGLQQLAVGRFRVGAVVRPDHDLARQKRVSLRVCAQYPLIIAKDNLALRPMLQPAIERLQLGSRQPIETASLELGKQLVLRGVGVAFQTTIGLERELRDGTLVHVPLDDEGPLKQDLGIYARAGVTLPVAVDAFVRIMKDEMARRQADEENVPA